MFTIAIPHVASRRVAAKGRADAAIEPGVRFHLSFENLERVLEHPHTYTIGETNYLLIELSNTACQRSLASRSFAWEIAG